MISQITVGSIVITLSVFVEVLFIIAAIKVLKKGVRPNIPPSLFQVVFYLSGMTLWMLLAFSLVAWIWAVTLILVGAMNELESALYFSMVAFTSLGFGDIVLDQPWRLLSGMMAANGLVLFGMNTAVIVETLRGILNSMNQVKP